MKKKLSMILASTLILTGLNGCQDEAARESSSISAASVNMEPTDEFVIYRPPYTSEWMVDAIVLFRQMYPDVKMTIADFSTTGNGGKTVKELSEEYSARVTNEVMVGEGPDIIFPEYLSTDLHKGIQMNFYLNLTPFFEQDKYFNEEDFMPNVFEAGRYKGKQYIVPTHVAYPQFLIRLPVMEQLGIDEVASENVASFLRQLGEKSQQAQELGYDRMMDQTMYFSYFLTWANLKMIDYENKQVCPEPEKVREFMEAYKTYYKWDYNNGEPDYGRTNSGSELPRLPKNYCYDSLFSEPYNFQMKAACYKEADGGYCDFFLRDMDGKINGVFTEFVAVPVTSKNQLNAYRFIQLLLSPSIQKKEIAEGEGYSYTGRYYCPVNREALEERIRDKMGQTKLGYAHDNGRVFDGWVKALPVEDWLEHIETMKTVDSTILADSTVADMVWEAMEPFFKDEKTYEACFDELKSKLTIYMDE